MAYLVLPKELLEMDVESMRWKLDPHFAGWCTENFTEPYSFKFVRTIDAGQPFSRYQTNCYMLIAGDQDAALTLLRYEGVSSADPDEEVEENKADRDLFR